MLNKIIGLFETTFSACIGWFEQIMEKTGMLPFYLGGLLVFFSVGFLLSPLRNGLPGGLSDSAASTYNAWNKKAVKRGAEKYRQKQTKVYPID